MFDVQHILSLGSQLGEGPLWNVKEQQIYWVDILGKKIFRYEPATGQQQAFEMQSLVGFIAFHESGKVMLGTNRGFEVWDEGVQYEVMGNIAHHPIARINDGAVDRRGRIWGGTADQSEGYLYCMDLDGQVNEMKGGVSISNGIGWAPDNKTMYYSDSGGDGIVYAYDFDLTSGQIDNQRTFLPPSGTAARADGLTVDSEGCLWVAFWDGWKICRYDPDGKLMLEINMPVQRPTSCNFGGANLQTLYVTSAAVGIDKSEQPLAGDLFAIQTDVRGLPEPDTRVDLNALTLKRVT